MKLYRTHVNNKKNTRLISESRILRLHKIMYSADDYIGLQIRDFKRKNITFEQFLQNIQYHKGVTFQYAFCTQKAVDKLIHI